jgi:cysteinyl-tRNA synthetase
MNRFYAVLKLLEDAEAGGQVTAPQTAGKCSDMKARLQEFRECFCEAMDDDFNTARAIGHLFDAVRMVNTVLAEKKPSASLAEFGEARRLLLEIGSVLGLFRQKAEDYLRQDREREAEKRGLSINEIERLIAERRAARAAKLWQRADVIRKDLADQGVILQDAPDATTWTIA